MQRPRVVQGIALFIFALLVVTGVLTVLGPEQTSAATSSTLNFQARLETSGGAIVPDGSYNVEFKLYDASSSSGSSQGSCTGDSDCLWTETRVSSDQVRVANGYLTVNLGSVTSFPSTINWNQQLWLTMRIGGTGSPSWDAEMSPRIQLTAVPYAFQAGELGNGTNRATLDASGNLTLQQASTISTSTGALTVQGATTLALQSTTSSSVTLDSGTTGTVNVATGGNSKTIQIGAANSAITDTINIGNNANVSGISTITIGSTSSTSALTLQGGTGNINLLTNSASASTIVKTNTNSPTAFQVQNSSSQSLLGVDTSNNAIVVGNDGTTTAMTIRGGVASASNTAGLNITFDASNGTGVGGSGDFIFRTASPSSSVVTLDNSWSTNDGAGGAAHTFTWSSGAPAVASGHSNYLLVVGVTITQGSSQTVASVTYNGTSLTKLTAINCTGTSCRNELWYTTSPTHDGASHNVVVTLSGAQTANYSVGATSYYNVDGTTPLQTPVTSSGTSTSGGGATFTTNSISTTTSQVALDVLATDQTVTNPGSQSVLWNNTSVDTTAAGVKPGTGGSISFSWTSNSAHWADILTTINPVANTTPDTLADRLHITAAGNIGVSTASPQYTLDVAGTQRVSTTSVGAFQVQDASSNQIFGVDTSAQQVLFGKAGTYGGKLVLYSGTASNSNTVTITTGNTSSSYTLTLPTALPGSSQCLQSSNTGVLSFTSCGGAGGGTTMINLIPEYVGATFSQYDATGSSSGTNTGFMQSDHVAGLSSGQGYKHNYYQWSTDQSSAQDYHIITEYQLPSSFSSFASGSFKIWTYIDSSTSTDLKFTMYDVDGTACYASLQSIKPGSTATWTQTTLSDPGNGCSFAAGDIVTMDIKMVAIQPQTNYVKVGELQFSYN